MPLAFLAAPVLAGAAALVFGFFCVRLSSIYFAMLTLAFAQIVYAIVHQWYEVTGGDNGLLGVWPPRVARHAGRATTTGRSARASPASRSCGSWSARPSASSCGPRAITRAGRRRSAST